VTKCCFGQNQYFYSIIYSIPRKSLIDRFSVKWQTNFLEQFSVFWPFLWPCFGWIYKIICKKYKSYGNVTNYSIFYSKTGISFDFWYFQSDHDSTTCSNITSNHIFQYSSDWPANISKSIFLLIFSFCTVIQHSIEIQFLCYNHCDHCSYFVIRIGEYITLLHASHCFGLMCFPFSITFFPSTAQLVH
jgi:hypothetical protein